MGSGGSSNRGRMQRRLANLQVLLGGLGNLGQGINRYQEGQRADKKAEAEQQRWEQEFGETKRYNDARITDLEARAAGRGGPTPYPDRSASDKETMATLSAMIYSNPDKDLRNTSELERFLREQMQSELDPIGTTDAWGKVAPNITAQEKRAIEKKYNRLISEVKRNPELINEIFATSKPSKPMSLDEEAARAMRDAGPPDPNDPLYNQWNQQPQGPQGPGQQRDLNNYPQGGAGGMYPGAQDPGSMGPHDRQQALLPGQAPGEDTGEFMAGLPMGAGATPADRNFLGEFGNLWRTVMDPGATVEEQMAAWSRLSDYRVQTPYWVQQQLQGQGGEMA